MKYHKLVENAGKPKGFWGRLMIRSMNKGHGELTEWALSKADIQNGCRALDVGCGGGMTVSRLCALTGSGKVYGIDHSDLCVRKSIERNRKNILCNKAEIIKSGVSELPFDGGSFDLVTAVETYYFWPDKQNDLKEIYRVLKSGGRLMLAFEMVADESDPGRWKAVEDRLGIKAVSPGNILETLENAGYINIKTYEQGSERLCVIAEKE